MTERMTEDNLLNDLGDLAHREEEAEQALLDERWDRLAAGTLSAEEDAELRSLAAASPEIREAYEAFRPLGAEFQARVTANIVKLARGPAPVPAPGPVEKLFARLLAFLRGPFRYAAWPGSVAAAAAVIFFVHSFIVVPPPPPLPPYTPNLDRGAQAKRGGEPVPAKGLPIFTPGSLLTLTARPAKTVEGAVTARAFFSPLAGDGDFHSLDMEPRIAKSGAVQLQGSLGREIQIPRGSWSLWIVVGRPGKIPSEGALAAAVRAGKPRGDGWQAISQDLRVEDRAPP